MSAELQIVEGEQQDKLVGTTIDERYLVEGVLGEGGMGLVYRARHIVLNKPLALKVLRPDVSKDNEIITRFRQEAQSASAIGNQHIIDISDFGTLNDGSTYFVMEYLEGTDLTGAIETAHQVDASRTIHIVKQLCTALGAAHEAGIVHRDLKPDNIFLVRRGNDSNFVKVLDFGIAKVGGSSSKLTRAGQVFGTPHYMSPEQCSGSGVDHRTDIYALGVIMYEMLTGQVPFDADNLMGILTKHLYEEPIPPRSVNAEISEELELVVLRAMTKQADERYQTMQEFQDDLQRLEQGIGTMARETTTATAISAPPASSKGPLVAAAAVILLGFGGGAAYFLAGPEEVVQPPVVENESTESTGQDTTEAIGDGDDGNEAETTGEEAAGVANVEGTEEPVAAPEKVRIVSTPDGAEVFLGTDLIGNTPIELDKPLDGERMMLLVHLPGYQDREVVISSFSQDEMNITLQAERRSNRTGRMRPVMRPEAVMQPAEHMQPSSNMRNAAGGGEVLDPWAGE